jgi:pimeloyl-ACP methyl ester carboxylesterase
MKENSHSASRVVFRLVRIVVLIYVGLVVLLAGCQRRMIYFPAKSSESVLRDRAAQTGWASWEDPEGHLLGWKDLHAPAPTQPVNRLLVFHGNAGFAQHRTYYRDGFGGVGGARWEVFVFEYPGYGARPGSPSEQAFATAGREALEFLWQADKRPVFLLGESLGSGVACRLAGEFPDRVAGLILTTPFTSLADVAARQYPVFPVRLLLRDRYDNVKGLGNYRGPMAVLLAGSDEIIPAEFGRRLFDTYDGPKRLWVQETATHNTLDYNPEMPWWDEVTDFLLQHRAGEPAN